MKSIIKKILSLICFWALLFGGLTFMYRVFSWKDTSGDYFSCVNQAYSLKDHIVDVAFFGPSVTYSSYNPAVFWEQSGLATFNYGVSGQDRSASTYYVKEFLKKQSPKVIVLSTTYVYTNTYAVQGNLYRNALSLTPSLNSFQMIRKVVPNNSLSTPQSLKDYYLRWPIVHSRYKELKEGDFVAVKENEYCLGFSYGFDSWNQEVFSSNSTDQSDFIPIDPQVREWVDSLKSLGDEKGFTLLFVTTPTDFSQGERYIINGFQQYLEEKGIPYLDLNQKLDDMDFNVATDMTDAIHANSYGATKISSYLGSYLKEHYDLKDHRGDVGYEVYEQCLSVYKHHLFEHSVLPTLDSIGLTAALAENTSFLYSVTVHPQGEITQKIMDLLGKAGVSNEQILQGGTWILRGTQILCSPDYKPYGIQVNQNDFLHVTPELSEKRLDTVSVGTTDYVTPYQTNCCIVTYDLVLDRVIDVHEFY